MNDEAPIHILKETKKEGGTVHVSTNCGATFKSKSRAEAFENCTAWTSLSSCAPCRVIAGAPG